SDNAALYGVGGGIVWDSECDAERRECHVKALVLSAQTEEFSLFETIRWTPREGYFLLGRHLLRIARSAAYFDYPLDLLRMRRKLKRLAQDLPPRPHKVRLLLSHDGEITCQADEIVIEETPPIPQVALASFPIDPCDPLLYHKTTRRRLYREALDEWRGFDDVILYNTRGEVTESTIANIVADLDGDMVTPSVESGLLPGTFRAWMLDKRLIREQALSVERLLVCPRLFLINSVRGMYQVSLDCYRKSLHVDGARHDGRVRPDTDSRHA
ncbi:MAG TPA: aminotransferase class IV, partial [Deltaproteobacteria bacterium]|nr:aminotransferase class IV [Deltaproteobacteria bacterium]